MVNVYIRNHPRIHEMVIDFIDFLGVFWGTGENPTLEELEHIMGINNEDEIFLLANVIDHLRSNNYILILLNKNGHEMYLQGENPFPQLYNYKQYCNEIPR